MSVEKRQLINNRTGEPMFPIGHAEATYDANGHTVEYRLAHETQSREEADADLQADVAVLQDTAARVGAGYDSDLAITDESGNAIAHFQNGHIKTKNFDSSVIPQTGDGSDDFAISDEQGHDIVEFRDGHIKTKNFDSKDTVKTDASYSDFSITDEQGISIADFVTGHIKTKKFDSSTVGKKKNIKMLAIGNSFAFDAFQYLPPLLYDMAEVDITLGILYRASCSVQLHEDFIRNDKVKLSENTDGYQLYSRYDPQTKRWITQYIDPPYPSDVIPSEDWDIITLQQHSAQYEVTTPYESTIQPYLPSIIDMLMGGVNDVKMTNNTKFGWLITPTGTQTDMDATFAKEIQCAQNILRDTVFDFVLPCGTGIHNARHTSLDDLGDSGHMTLDGLHLQGGIPMLIESYVAALKILELAGYGEVGIIGNRIRPTTEWEVNQNLPSRRGTPVGVNDADIMLAQKCAIWAIKKPFEITENIEPSNT